LQKERLNDQIGKKKLEFGLTIGRIFAYTYPHLVTCDLINDAIRDHHNQVAFYLVVVGSIGVKYR